MRPTHEARTCGGGIVAEFVEGVDQDRGVSGGGKASGGVTEGCVFPTENGRFKKSACQPENRSGSFDAFADDVDDVIVGFDGSLVEPLDGVLEGLDGHTFQTFGKGFSRLDVDRHG